MSTIVDALHDDHVNVVQVIELAEQAISELEAGRSADYALLEDVMRYMTGYSDTHHHPVEDIVFHQLRERAPEMAPALDAILAEHETIISKGKRFLGSVAAAEEDALLPRSALVELGREYLSLLKAHMDVEEGELFPAAEAKLRQSDWDNVRDQIEHRPDPLFGASLDEDYRRLWKLIQLHKPK